MACSPLLRGITDPLAVLRVVRDHPVLACSEPPQTFYPLREQGWAEYGDGRWRITPEGRAAAEGDVPSRPASLADFFEL